MVPGAFEASAILALGAIFDRPSSVGRRLCVMQQANRTPAKVLISPICTTASVLRRYRCARCLNASLSSEPLSFLLLPMDLHTWLAFAAATCLIALSPGSGAVLSMSHGLSYGVRRTTATILGLQLGLMLLLLVAGAGVGSLLLASELAFSVVKVAGACYLIFVGFSQWRADVGVDADAQMAPGAAPAVRGPLTMRLGTPAGTWQRRFATGFLTNATNPKGIVFMVAVLPQFMTDSRPLWSQLLVMAVTSVAIDMTVMHGYAMGASSLRRMLQSQRAQRNQNRVFGGVLMAVGAGLFFVRRGGQGAV